MGISTAATGWWLKLLTDGVTQHRSREALLAVFALAATLSLMDIVKLSLARMRLRLQEHAGLLVERQLVEMAASLPGLEHHERPEYLDRMEHLRAERATLGQAIGSLTMTCSTLIQVLGTAALLTTVSPYLLLLTFLGLPSLWTGAKSMAVLDRAKRLTAEQTRLTAQYVAMATTLGPAKEVRIFGLGEEILDRHRRVGEKVIRTRIHGRLVGAHWDAGGSLLFIMGYLGALAFVVHRATLGQATAGDVVLTLGLVGQINGNFTTIIGVGRWLKSLFLMTGYFLWFADDWERAMSARAPGAPPSRLAQGIAFEDVSFRYPDTERDVLANLNLALPAGATVALVGDNGAGKSVLVKCIAGIHTPERGQILWEGRPVHIRTPKDSAALGIETVYQDLALCDNLDIVQNMFLGRERLSHLILDEDNMERAAAETLAGLAVTSVRSIRQPVASLSGGQRQSVAVAKAVMWNSKLVIMDEPTAALGVAQTRMVLDLIKRLADKGLAVLIISHNLNDVFEVADRIAVLHLGHLVSSGPIEEYDRQLVVELMTTGQSKRTVDDVAGSPGTPPPPGAPGTGQA
jgi:D-xylose transport system ATP-binding protein